MRNGAASALLDQNILEQAGVLLLNRLSMAGGNTTPAPTTRLYLTAIKDMSSHLLKLACEAAAAT